MVINKYILAFCSSFVAAGAGAQSYQAEVGGAFQRLASDNIAFDLDGADVFGRWHFDSVDTGGHPLAEAAFLERSSNVSLAYEEMHIITGLSEAGENPRQVRDSRNTVVGAVSYYVPDTFLFLEAEYLHARYSSGGRGFSTSDDSWGAAIGVTPADGLLMLTRYSDDRDYRLNLEAQYVTALSEENALRLEAAFYDWESSDSLTVGGDYYLDRSWSIGGWVETSSDTGIRLNTSDNGVGIRSRKFLSDNFSVAGFFYKFGSVRRYGLSASLRF